MKIESSNERSLREIDFVKNLERHYIQWRSKGGGGGGGRGHRPGVHQRTLFSHFKNAFKNLKQKFRPLPKMRTFWKKDVKSPQRSSFVKCIYNIKTYLLLWKIEQQQMSRFCFFLAFSPIFHFKHCRFVRGGAKYILTLGVGYPKPSYATGTTDLVRTLHMFNLKRYFL